MGKLSKEHEKAIRGLLIRSLKFHHAYIDDDVDAGDLGRQERIDSRLDEAIDRMNELLARYPSVTEAHSRKKRKGPGKPPNEAAMWLSRQLADVLEDAGVYVAASKTSSMSSGMSKRTIFMQVQEVCLQALGEKRSERAAAQVAAERPPGVLDDEWDVVRKSMSKTPKS